MIFEAIIIGFGLMLGGACIGAGLNNIAEAIADKD